MPMTEPVPFLQTIVRCRPNGADDDGSSTSTLQFPSANTITIPSARQSYSFHRVYAPDADTDDIANDTVDTMIDRVVLGYHAAVIVYGASNAGKSRTLQGRGSELGLMTLATNKLFAKLTSDPRTKSLVSVSAVSLTGNTIIDLLAPNTASSLSLADHRNYGASVSDVTELVVKSANDCSALLQQCCNTNTALSLRHSVNTTMKPHLVFELRVEVTDNSNSNDSGGMMRSSIVRFVQCAGSGGASLKFNAGLSSLHTVIAAINDGKSKYQIPYHSSNLTRLLSFALSGNAHTVLLACVNNSEDALEDTMDVLEFAQNFSRIAVNPHTNRSSLTATMKQLREEVEAIREKMQLTSPAQTIHEIDPALISSMEELLNEIEQCKRQTWRAREVKSSQEMTVRRTERLAEEGLTFVLSNSAPLADRSLVERANSLLASLTTLMQSIDSTESVLHDSRKQHAETKSDALTATITSSEATLRTQRESLTSLSQDYQSLMTEMIVAESENRSIAASIGNPPDLLSLTFGDVRQSLSSNNDLIEELNTIASNTALMNDALNGRMSAISDETVRQSVSDDIGRLLSDWMVASQSVSQLTYERDELWRRTIEAQFRHAALITLKEQHHQSMFAQYRKHFEQQKQRLDTKWRIMLESAVSDTLRLQEENARLKGALRTKIT